MLKDRASRGVRARLEDRPQAPPRKLVAQAAQGLRDGGGMMPEIVDDLDPAHLAAHFLPPLHAFEGLERRADCGERHAIKMRRADRHRRVANVVFANEW